MNKIKLMKQIFTLLMVMITLVSSVPITVFAEGAKETTVLINAFNELSEDVRKQNVPYGTEISELNLPESLTAISSANETVNVMNIKWVSSPDYKGDVPGSYNFLAVLPAEYSLAEGVGMPEVSVTVDDETLENLFPKLMNSPVITRVTTAEELNSVFQSGGQAVLDINIVLSEPLVVAQGKNVTLDLNGKKIDRGLTKDTAQFYGNVITVNGSLTIEDSQGTGIITGGAKNAYTGGGGVYVNGGTFTLNGGNIVGNTAKGYGGGVLVESGTFDMNGGTISGNTSSGGEISGSGGGVCVNSGSSFTINGGEIIGNTAMGSGGGVYANGGSFIMNNGTISGNMAVGATANDSYGGGVSVMYGGSFIMYAGEIRGNTVQGGIMAGKGGGVYVNMSGSFTMRGGIIRSNEAEQGGGVYLQGSVYPSVGTVSSFTMSAGQISENTTDSSSESGYGGGVYVIGGTFSISSGSRIISNSAATGGGIFMLGGTCSMENSEVSNNSTFGSTLCNGGGIHLAGGNFTMNSGKINNNKAIKGGGVYIFGGVFTMKDGQINENTAYVVESQLCDGGGVYLSEDGTFNMEGGEIRGNSTSSWYMYNHGGGVYVYGGVFRVSGAVSIIDNNRSGIPNNVYLKTDTSKIEVAGALTGGKIGISTSIAPEGTTTLLVAEGSGTYTISDTDNNKFISDIGGGLNMEGNTIVLSKPPSSYLIFLSYNSNGGSGTLGSSAILEGMDNELTVASGNSFSRTNCSFAGWNTKADGSGTAYQPGDKLILTADTTLYSQWTIDKTELTLTPPNGGAIPSTSVACVPSGITAVVSWKHDGESLNGSFNYNTAYSVEITLTTGSGCIFANTPEVRINGQSATIQSRSNSVMVVNFTFPKTGPLSKPTVVLSPVVKDVPNTGGTRILTLDVAGISEGYNPVTWTMSKTDVSNILNLPSTTEGILSNGTLNLGSIVISANEVGHPPKNASVTITFGGNKDGEYAGVPASITVIFQLDAGTAPDAVLDFVNEKITGVTAGMEYIVDGSTNSPDDWTGATLVTGTEIPLSGIIPEAGLSTKYVHIRLRDIIGSVSTTIAIPARPDLVDFFKDTWDYWVDHNIENDVELGYVYWDFSYRINNGEDMPGSSESYLEIPLKPGDTLTFWMPASKTSFKSAEITVTAPSRIEKPNVAIDFAVETLNTTNLMQYRLSSENDWTNCTADMAASDFGWDGTTAVSIQLRYPFTDKNYASEAQILTIPPYPPIPVISYTSNATSITITAETGVRYRLNGGEWKIADGNSKVVFAGLTANQSYTVVAQKLLTESSFQSKEASLSVSTKSLDDGIGSVSMANWTYGDTASEPVPESVTNGTSNVTYSYAGTKADGTAYSSSIKPTDAGDYTVIATFAATSEYKAVTSNVKSFTIYKKDIDVQWTEQHYIYDGTEKTATYSLPDLEAGDVGMVSVSISGGQRISAGYQRVSASLVGSRASNYALTNPVGTLIIQRAPVTFTVGNNSVYYNGHPQAITITATVNGSEFKDYVVNYKQGGTVVPAPTDIGVYDIYASFNNTNYRHVNGADGAERKIGVLVIFEQTPTTYKTSFTPGKGSGTIDSMIDAVAGTVRILPNCTFDAGEQGYVFAGWKLDDKLYPAGAVFEQPARDVSFTAEWVPCIHSVSGTVRQNGTIVKGTVMTLMHGSRKVVETVTDSNGRYQFNNVIPGFYNLVGTKDGITVTIKIEVKMADLTVDMILPHGKTNSVVEVLAGTPAITVGNLEKIFEWQDGVVFTNADQVAVNLGGTVEIRITAEVVAENLENSDQKKIVDNARGSNPVLYMDIRLNKSLTSGGSTVETPLTTSNTLLEIVVPLTPELQGKDSYIVYRYHDGEVQMLTTTQNSKGEYITVNADKTSMTIYAKLFSTYAIGYTTPSSQGSKDNGSASIGYTITATAGDGGRISPSGTVSVLKGDSITFTVTPDKGNVISDVLVDGVSVGKVSSYTFSDITANHSIKPVFARETGLPYYLDAAGNKVFIGFSSDASGKMKYIAPKGETVLFSQNPKNFMDIGNHWAKSSVDFIAQREIFQGTGNGMFSPDTGMTRGMFATVIGRLYERSYGILGPLEFKVFTDIETDAYYSKYVAWAEKNGIIKGIGGGKFGPNLSITREEMVLLLYRFARFMGVPETEISGIELSYSDASEISPWAIDAAKYCQKTNLIVGSGNARFAPKKTATRAEVAVILQRYIKTMVY